MGPQTRNIALIVVDMQNNFSDIMGSLTEKLNDLAAFMRERGVPVIYTYHGTPDPANEEDKDVLVAFWGADGCIKRNTDAWQLTPDLGNQPDDLYIKDKNTYDSFQNTRLEAMLRERGVDTVIVGGLATNMCCGSTARSAFTKNFNAVLLSDANNAPEKSLHEASLKEFKEAFGKVMSCEEVKEKFADHRQGSAMA